MFPHHLIILSVFCISPLFAHGGHHHSHEDEDCCHDEHIIVLSDKQIHDSDITIAKTGSGDLIQYIHAPGKVALPSQAIVHVVPRVSGIVTQVFKKIGDNVQEGEVLALLESREIAESKAEYLAAKRRLELKLNLLQKEKSLHSQKLISDMDYWEREGAAEEAKISLELSRQKLQALGLSSEAIFALPAQNPEALRIYELRAPINGVIIDAEVASGEYITPENEVAVLADMKKRWLEIDVPPPHQHLIKNNLPAMAKASHGEACTTQLECYKPLLQESTRTLKAYAKLDSKYSWPVGMYVTVLINGETLHFPLVIPKSAVQQMDGKTVVFVSHPEGFEIRSVVLGPSDEESIAVIEGLHKGEKIAVKNSFLLKAEHEKDEAEHEH